MTNKKPCSNNRRRRKKIKRFWLLNTVLSAMVIIVISFAASVIFRDQLLGNDRYILGFRSFITLSDSMNPHIRRGSLVIIRRVDPEAVQVEDVITYTSGPDTLTYRVIEIVDNYGDITFVTKGDANEGANLNHILSDDLVGRYVFSTSLIGSILIAMRNPVFMSLFVGGLCVFFVTTDMLSQHKKRRQLKRKRRKLHRQRPAAKKRDYDWKPVPNDFSGDTNIPHTRSR